MEPVTTVGEMIRLTVLAEMIRRPLILIEAVRAFFATRKRRRLFPSKAYLEWRAYTAYGDHRARINDGDLFDYLAWRRHLRTSMNGRRLS